MNDEMQASLALDKFMDGIVAAADPGDEYPETTALMTVLELLRYWAENRNIDFDRMVHIEKEENDYESDV